MSSLSLRAMRRPRLRGAGACTALALAAAAVAAVPAQASRHAAATPGKCTVVVAAAPWTIRGSGSGTAYKVVAVGMPCTVARTWAHKLSYVKGTGANGVGVFRGGPTGFTCHSFATPASGDKLIYAGACAARGGHPFFGWAAKPA